MDGKDSNSLTTPLTPQMGPTYSMQLAQKSRMDTLMRDFKDWSPFANKVFYGHTGPVWSCAMTSDNKTIFSGAEDGGVKVWTADTQELICDLEGHVKCVNGLVVTNDDKYLISGDWGGSIIIWDWKEKQQVDTLTGHTAGVYAFVLSKDGKYLFSGGGDYCVRIWDIESRRQIGKCDNAQNSVFGIAVTKDNTSVVAGGWGGTITIYKFENCSQESTKALGAGVVQCMALTNSNAYLIVGTRNNLIKVLDYPSLNEYCSFSSHQNWVRNVVSTPDSAFLISVSADKSIRIFNIANKQEELSLEGSEGYVFGEFISNDGKYLLTGASDKLMRLWTLGTPLSRTMEMKGHKKCIMCLSITSDSKWAVTGSEDESIRIWNIENGVEVAKLLAHSGTVWGLTITYDDKYIASVGADKKVIIWDLKGRENIQEFTNHTAAVFAATSSRDSRYIITGAQDKNLAVFDLQQMKFVKFLEGHTDTVFSVKVTHDNKFIVSAGADYTVRIWDLAKLEYCYKLDNKGGMIESVSLSFDDKYLAMGDRANLVNIWDFNKKKVLKRFTHHTKWVKNVSFASSGYIFASASNDNTVRVWNASEERHELLLKGHTNTVRAVAISNDNRYVISAGEDTTIIRWNIKDVERMELSDFGHSLDSFLFLSKIKTKDDPSAEYFQSIFGNLRVNLAHFYAYLGYNKQLENALNLGTEIRIDDDGRSPLYYALERCTQSCVDILLRYMVELKEANFEKFMNYCLALRNDFEKLLENHSVVLPEYLEAIFYTVRNTVNFGVPKTAFPMLRYSESHDIDESYFLEKPSALNMELEKPIQFKTMPFQISYISGSSGSIDILDSISTCPNRRILQTEFVLTFVRQKWNDLWTYILILTLMLWGNIILMCALIIASDTTDEVLRFEFLPLAIAFFALNILLAVYEMVQVYSVGRSYFQDFWNWIDIGRLALTLSWTVLLFFVTHQNLYILTWFMAIINFFRGLTGFRAFDETRYYTRLIIRSFKDSIFFILIFFYSTFAFGIIYYTSKPEVDSETTILMVIWKSPYELNMGSFDDGAFDTVLSYMYFMMASVINVIIMLSLLISILGDSFESFQLESQEIDCLEMAELVIELESLMYNKRGMNDKTFFQKCKELVVEGSGDWEGRIKSLTATMDKNKKEILTEVRGQINALNKKIDILLRR